MLEILNKLARYRKHQPERSVLFDSCASPGVSYLQLDEISAQVRAYLKRKKVGRENFVAICLPRGVTPAIAMLGVLKAGAAFVVLEEHYAPERTARIKDDCQCALVIDYAVWQEIQHEEPCYQIAPLDEHAAAFAVYTSGSTGTPKGVVHEYGNIPIICRSACFEGKAFFQPHDIFALVAPWPFIASVTMLLVTLDSGCSLHILPYACVKDLAALHGYLLASRATQIFLTPTYLRLYQNISPHLSCIHVSSEPARHVYRHDITLYNSYSMSECGFGICSFKIDRLYDLTPIGKPQFPLHICLLDEQGQPVPEGQSGELCVHNPFVRGYRNRAEQNSTSFRRDHMYHSGDMACRLADGNYVLVGRCTDMIKIHGNRIEPAEIEAAVRQVLNVDWVAAKGFVEDDSAFVCVYYVQDIQVDYESTRKALQQRLPYYMLPAHFIKIPEIPLNANGKFDRKALQAPAKNLLRAPYTPPTCDHEQQLCAAFALALQLDHIGIHDDFYLLGGDSLGAIAVLSACRIAGLTISEIFRARTPANIAALCATATNPAEAPAQDLLHRCFPLTPEQISAVDYQLYTPKSTMYNLFLFLRMDAAVDLPRLVAALNATLQRHPALHTVFDFDEDGAMIQCHDPSLAENILVEQLSEEKLAHVRDTLVQPFKIVRSRMYRCRIFETERAAYLFLDVHHTVFDGTSFTVLLADINALYHGHHHLLHQDNYYQLLALQEQASTHPHYAEGKNYFEHRYGHLDFASLPKPDVESRKNTVDCVHTLLPCSGNAIDACARDHGLSPNVLFIALTALALGAYNHHPAAEFTWLYNGRDSLDTLHTVGLIFNVFPVCTRLPDQRALKEIFADIKEQVAQAIEYNAYHYSAVDSRCMIGEKVCMIYQDSLHRIDSLCGTPVESIEIRQNKGAAAGMLDIEILRHRHALEVRIKYNAARYSRHTVHELLKTFVLVTKNVTELSSRPECTVGDVLHRLPSCTSAYAALPLLS